jgi:hypothetical protein
LYNSDTFGVLPGPKNLGEVSDEEKKKFESIELRVSKIYFCCKKLALIKMCVFSDEVHQIIFTC